MLKIRTGWVVVVLILCLILFVYVMSNLRVKITDEKIQSRFNNMNIQAVKSCQTRNMLYAGLIIENQSIKANCYTQSPLKFYKIK